MLNLKKWIAKVSDHIRYAEFYGYSAASLPDKSLANGTSWINIGSIKPPKGVWHINVTVVFPSNATGRRLVTLSRNSAAFGTALSTSTAQAVNGYSTYLHSTMIEYFDGNTTLYINASQNSGSAMTVNIRYTAYKIGTSYRNVS